MAGEVDRVVVGRWLVVVDGRVDGKMDDEGMTRVDGKMDHEGMTRVRNVRWKAWFSFGADVKMTGKMDGGGE